VRSLQDRIAFIINIYQYNKFIQSVMSTLKRCKIYTSSWNSVGINLGGWAVTITSKSRTFVVLLLCNERGINRVHLTFSLFLYTNCQNRPCGKEFNTTAFVNLEIYDVYVNIILWRNLNIVSTKLFPQSDLLRYQWV
jgi:hypothetical protein